MVLKFEEYINEGLWSSGMKRAETGEERLEDKSPFSDYLKTIKWVDMDHPDYLFAENDLEETLYLDELEEGIKKLPKDICIMDENVCTKLITWTFLKGDTSYKNKINDKVGIVRYICKETDEKIYFINEFNRTYYLRNQGDNVILKFDLTSNNIRAVHDYPKRKYSVKLLKKK